MQVKSLSSWEDRWVHIRSIFLQKVQFLLEKSHPTHTQFYKGVHFYLPTKTVSKSSRDNVSSIDTKLPFLIRLSHPETFVFNPHNSSFTKTYLFHVYQCYGDIPSNHHHHCAAIVIHTYKRKKNMPLNFSQSSQVLELVPFKQGRSSHSSEFLQCMWFPS